MVPGSVLAYACVRVRLGPPLGPRTWALAALAAAWALGAVLPLLGPRSRAWLAARRRKVAASWGASLLALAGSDLVLTWTGAVPTIAEAQSRSVLYRASILPGAR